MRLAEKDVYLRRLFTKRNHLLDPAISGFNLPVLQKRQSEWIVKLELLWLRSNDLSQQRRRFREVADHEITHTQQLLDRDVVRVLLQLVLERGHGLFI